ncbi:MAG TPA: ZIP family metal transporter [Candidatus Saccharimonadales bacterium]
MDVLIVLFWTLVGSVFSLIGGIALVGNKKLREKAIRYGMPFGAGALLAAAFLGVLPEAIEGSSVHTAMVYALGGFLGFFVLERLLSWFHHHESHHHDKVHGARNETHQWLVIIGDTLHNAIDGVAIGAAFLVSPAAGIGAALAVAAHEIPQEIGDFSILLGKGMKPRKVVLVNLLSALATVVTAMATYLLGGLTELNPAPLLAVAAGFFVYIAASDIVPDIHEKSRREGNVQAVILLIGVAVLAFVIQLTPHSHAHHEESTESVHGQHQEMDVHDHHEADESHHEYETEHSH